MLNGNVQVGGDPPVEIDLKGERVQRELAAPGVQAQSADRFQVEINFNGSRLVVTLPAPPRGDSPAAIRG